MTYHLVQTLLEFIKCLPALLLICVACISTMSPMLCLGGIFQHLHMLKIDSLAKQTAFFFDNRTGRKALVHFQLFFCAGFHPVYGGCLLALTRLLRGAQSLRRHLPNLSASSNQQKLRKQSTESKLTVQVLSELLG